MSLDLAGLINADHLSAHITAGQQILLPALRDIVPGGGRRLRPGEADGPLGLG